MAGGLDKAAAVPYGIRMNNDNSPYLDPVFDAYPDKDLIQEVWDIVDDNVPLLWDDVKLRTDRNLHMAIARVLLHNHPKWTVPPHAVASRIAPWVKRPEEVSPYLDQVAIDRAVALDSTVLSGLTTPERREVGRLLAAMEDPWGDRTGDFSEWPGPDPRRIAWRNMGAAARSRFQELVREAREEVVA